MSKALAKGDWFKEVRSLPSGKGDYHFKLNRIAECSCGNHYPFFSQDNLESSEYVTQITLECECGNYVVMDFPVN